MMSSGFGFSTGDFIAAVRLIADVIKALDESRGSSSQYLELIKELQSLQLGILSVKTVDATITNAAQKVVLRLQVSECHKTIDRFWAKISKYDAPLSVTGSTNKYKDAF
jgi:hypothetical protein